MHLRRHSSALFVALVAVLAGAGTAGARIAGMPSGEVSAARDCRPPISTATGRSASSTVPKRPINFGAYAPSSPEQDLAAVERLEGDLGLPVRIVSWYQHWGGWGRDFDAAWVDRVVGSGRVALLTWEPWTPGGVAQPDYALARIAAGAFDPYIRAWARALRAYGRVVYLRPMHEMNSNWYPWSGSVNGNSPALYVSAWRRLWEVFRAEGAANVRWVWSVAAEDVPATPENALERYYPGRRYVDVLAVDGYNWGSGHPEWGGWRSFDAIFACAYERLTRLGPQPVWITETASAPEGGDKAAWITDMLTSAPRYPRLETLVWFNTAKERDWRATSPHVQALGLPGWA
jgi:hypothetical protein